MSVLVYADNHQGKFPKSSFEAVSYAAEIAATLGTDAVAFTERHRAGAGVTGWQRVR